MLPSRSALVAALAMTTGMSLMRGASADLPGLSSFKMKAGDRVYPVSSTRQEERQRRQFMRATAKATTKATAKATVVTLESDGSTKTAWKDAEGYHSLWTGVPDPDPVFHTPFAAVPIAAKEQA